MKFQKQLFFILVMLHVQFSFSNNNKVKNISEIRKMFYEAVESKSKSEKMLNELAQHPEKNKPLILGYYGGAHALMAKHSFFPTTKMSYLKESLALINKSVQMDPQNAELRHLRFSTEVNIPSFLGMSFNLNDDKQAILQFLIKQKVNKDNASLLNQYVHTLLKSGMCNIDEKQKLKQISEQCKAML